MRRYLPFLLAVFCGFFAIGLVGVRIARGDAGSALPVLVDAGPTASQDAAVAGSGSSIAISSPTTPADKLHDPLEAPLAALDDAQTARKTSWPLFLFTLLSMITKALAYGSAALQGVPLIGPAAKWLAVAKRAMWVAGIGTIAAAGVNTLAAGGTWVALLMALGLAAAGVTHSTTQPKAPA